MKRVGFILLSILYFVAFGTLIYFNFDFSKKHTEGRIEQIVECGYDDNYNTMYQAEYSYYIDDTMYIVAGECANTYASDVDIIYDETSPKQAYIYSRTWKSYLLLVMSVFTFVPLILFTKGINKEITQKLKGIFLGIDLIFTSVTLFYFLGKRFAPLDCFVTAELNSLFPIGIFVIAILCIIFPTAIFRIKDKLKIED